MERLEKKPDFNYKFFMKDLNDKLKEKFWYWLVDFVEYELKNDGSLDIVFFTDDEDFEVYTIYQEDEDYLFLVSKLRKYLKKESWFKFFRYTVLNRLIREADKVETWIDRLRFSISWSVRYFDRIMSILDGDNSNIYVDEERWITWVKLRLFSWDCLLWSTVYKWVSVPIILYNVFDDERWRQYKSYWKIDLYGMYWRLVELWWLWWDFIESFFEEDEKDILHYSNITRMDYKIDLFYKEDVSLPNPKELLKIRKNSKLSLNVMWSEEIENRWYWSKSSKRVYLRVYDKLKDTEVKWKYVFYEDYFNYKKVVRIEFELLNHFCKWYKYKDYLQLVEKLRDSMKVKYLWKVFYEYNDEPDFNRVYERVRYFKDFIWRWYRILENWYNPFVILYEGLKDKNVREEELVDLVYKLYEKVWNR